MLRTIRTGLVLEMLLCIAIALISASIIPAYDGMPPDVVMLTSGGQIEGRVTETKEGNRTIIVVQVADGTSIKIAKDQIKSIRRPKDTYVEYLDKKSKMADTIDAHWEMALWCREHLDSNLSNGPTELGPERRYHMQAILKIDPDHKQARSFLGFTKEKGVWINLEQKRLGHGFIRNDRRWMTREEVAQEQANEAWKDLQTNWARRLKKLRSANGKEAESVAELSKITEPAAIQPIIELLADEKSEDWQLAFVDVLGQVHSSQATRALCDIAVKHPNLATRERAISRLSQEHIDKRSATQYLARQFLNLPNNEIINRAGFVIGEVGEFSAVMPLIEALNTEHIVKNPNARSPGSIAPSFGSDGSIGMQQGGGGPVELKITKKNESVLNSLRRFTKADLGFNEILWKEWFAQQHTLIDVDVRRDE